MVKLQFYDPDKQNKPKKAHKVKHRKQKGGFTMDWVSELGWSENPFRMLSSLAGMEDARKEINLFFVKQKNFGVVSGAEGMGKTTVMLWLKDELKGYKDMDSHYISAKGLTDVDFLEMVYAPYKKAFGGSLPEGREQLVQRVVNKKSGRYVLLVDDADVLEDTAWAAIEALNQIDSSIVVSMKDAKKSTLPDELELKLTKPSNDAYVRILTDRIGAVGGSGIKPFTEDVVATMAKDTDSIREFLGLAEETAINIALKHAAFEEDVSEEDLAADEEEKAEKKKGIKKKPDGNVSKKSAKKREYDELIESLIED